MVYHYDYHRPDELTVAYNLGRRQATINFDITELPEGDPTGYRFSWRSVTLEPGVWSYGAIVTAIIYLEYTNSQIEAMSANLLGVLCDLLDEGVEKINEYKEEFGDFQQWRHKAKEVAAHFLAKYPDINKVN